MNERVKIIISLLLVLSIVCFAGTAFVYTRSETFKEELGQVRSEKEKITQQLDEHKQELKNISEKFAKIQQEKETMLAEMTELKNQTNQLTRKIATEIEQRKNLKTGLEQKIQELQKLQNEYAESMETFHSMKAELENTTDVKTHLESEKQSLIDEIANLEQELEDFLHNKGGVELQGVVVTPENDTPSSETIATKDWFSRDPAMDRNQTFERPFLVEESLAEEHRLTGRVLIYNKEYDFVIIDLGERDFVEKGEMFEVLERGRSIGTIRVERVYDRMSAGIVVERKPNAVFLKNHYVRSI